MNTKKKLTRVTAKCCRTCSHAQPEHDHYDQTTVFYCMLGLMGHYDCSSFEREPGVEG
jgi:hypothetical protein